MNDGLSYTFRSYHDKVKSKKIEPKNYIFDLEQTMTLNLNLIESIIPSIHTKKLAERSKILEKFKKINLLFQKKIELFKNKNNIKGRILINKQIFEEKKYSKTENISYYKNQYEELFSNFIRKDFTLKKFHKKFLDIEKYVKREFVKLNNNNVKIYSEFSIEAYIVENENLRNVKFILEKEKKKIESHLKMIKKENMQLKIRDNIQLTQGDILRNSDYNEYNKKYSILLTSYSEKISFLENSINKIKKNLNSIYKKQKTLENGFFDKSDYLDEKTINVSILSNIKPNDSNFLEGFTKRSNFGWDISCIEKNNID